MGLPVIVAKIFLVALGAFTASKTQGCVSSTTSQLREMHRIDNNKPDWMKNPPKNVLIGKSQCMRFVSVMSLSRAIEFINFKLRSIAHPQAVKDIISQACQSGRGYININPWYSQLGGFQSYHQSCEDRGYEGVQLYLKAKKEDVRCSK